MLTDFEQNTVKAVLDISDHSAWIILRKKTIGMPLPYSE